MPFQNVRESPIFGAFADHERSMIDLRCIAACVLIGAQLHVVHAADGALVSNRVVELKGLGMNDDLTARLTERGAAWMADQVDQVIAWSASPGTSAARRCPA